MLKCDHELVMMTFKLHLRKVSKQGHSRIRVDLEKLKDPEVAEMFKARIGGKFAPLTLLDADDVNMDDLINKFNVAVTETANETLGKYRHHKQLTMGYIPNPPFMQQAQGAEKRLVYNRRSKAVQSSEPAN